MLQDTIGEQDVTNAIPRMQGAGGADRDHAAGLNRQGGGDGNHRSDLTDATAQESDRVCVNAADEQCTVGKSWEWVCNQIGGECLEGGALLTERGSNERWA
jgi:hypothetical protein